MTGAARKALGVAFVVLVVLLVLFLIGGAATLLISPSN